MRGLASPRLRGEARPQGRNERSEAGGGERLSGVSSCICELFSRIACFGVEDDEEYAGQRDADDHVGLSGVFQPLLEGGEVGIVLGDDPGDEKEDAAGSGAATAHGAAAGSLAAVVGEGGE